jgi:predicted RNase H-like HicB family nuclease
MKTIKDYAVQVYWDDRAKYFVAEIPEIPTCAADGATPADAIANLEETFAVMKEAYTESDLTMPAPNPASQFSINQLATIATIVKVAKIAKLADIPGQTLASKLKRRTPFSTAESRKLTRVLREHGLAVI